MQLGMIGLGRMGANMVRRLIRDGHTAVVYDRSPDSVASLVKDGATGASSVEDFVKKLTTPRVVWLMVPAAAVDSALASLRPLLSRGDIVIDGGNSHYQDDIARAQALRKDGLHYVDVGTSGGVWGLDRGYCLMIGGDKTAVTTVEPIFKTLSPGPGSIPQTKGRESKPSTAEHGYLHCGPSGAGHFVKMIHNGIEYGLMAAYAEGFNILSRANAGKSSSEPDAETTPLRNPEHYQYDFDLADVAEVWRRGSNTPAALRTRARGAGPSRRLTTKACPRTSSPPRCSSDSRRAITMISRTRCYRRCDLASAATRSRSERARSQRRAGVFRRDRRPCLQKNFSRAVRDGEARQAVVAGGRRRALRLESRSIHRARAQERHGSRRDRRDGIR